MKNESAYIKKFNALLKKVRKSHAEEPPDPADPVAQLIIGYLQWNATRKQAETAFKRLMDELVDFNDVRVSFTPELIGLIGPKYPRVEERAARLHDALQAVYVREHGMSLDRLADKTKKQVREYLETLPGMTPFVARQVLLLSYGAHAVPVDDKLADLLKAHDAVDPEATPDEIGAFIERRVKAGEGPQVHAALQAWADSGRKGATGGRKKAAKKTAKKSKRTVTVRKKK